MGEDVAGTKKKEFTRTQIEGKTTSKIPIDNVTQEAKEESKARRVAVRDVTEAAATRMGW